MDIHLDKLKQRYQDTEITTLKATLEPGAHFVFTLPSDTITPVSNKGNPMKKLLLSLLLSSTLLSPLIQADDWKTSRVDSHAPIGVMGDHLHHPGELMASYRYMEMSMNSNKTGFGNTSVSDILVDYTVAPEFMRMKMHMLGLMIAPTDNITLMLMTPFIINTMKMKMRDGTTFNTKSSGLGDLSLTALVSVTETPTYKSHLNLGLSFPTGKLDAHADTPMGNDTELGYPMRASSGTIDLKPGMTYRWQKPTYSYGGQALTTIRIGKNTENYTLGNQLLVTAWIAKPLDTNLSVSLRGQYTRQGNISGSDADLNKTMSPVMRSSLRGGKQADIALGMNWYIPSGVIKGNRFAAELGFPVAHDLEGPQLAQTFWYTLGWQLTF